MDSTICIRVPFIVFQTGKIIENCIEASYRIFWIIPWLLLSFIKDMIDIYVYTIMKIVFMILRTFHIIFNSPNKTLGFRTVSASSKKAFKNVATSPMCKTRSKFFSFSENDLGVQSGGKNTIVKDLCTPADNVVKNVGDSTLKSRRCAFQGRDSYKTCHKRFELNLSSKYQNTGKVDLRNSEKSPSDQSVMSSSPESAKIYSPFIKICSTCLKENTLQLHQRENLQNLSLPRVEMLIKKAKDSNKKSDILSSHKSSYLKSSTLVCQDCGEHKRLGTSTTELSSKMSCLDTNRKEVLSNKTYVVVDKPVCQAYLTTPKGSKIQLHGLDKFKIPHTSEVNEMAMKSTENLSVTKSDIASSDSLLSLPLLSPLDDSSAVMLTRTNSQFSEKQVFKDAATSPRNKNNTAPQKQSAGSPQHNPSYESCLMMLKTTHFRCSEASETCADLPTAINDDEIFVTDQVASGNYLNSACSLPEHHRPTPESNAFPEINENGRILEEGMVEINLHSPKRPEPINPTINISMPRKSAKSLDDPCIQENFQVESSSLMGSSQIGIGNLPSMEPLDLRSRAVLYLPDESADRRILSKNTSFPKDRSKIHDWWRNILLKLRPNFFNRINDSKVTYKHFY